MGTILGSGQARTRAIQARGPTKKRSLDRTCGHTPGKQLGRDTDAQVLLAIGVPFTLTILLSWYVWEKRHDLQNICIRHGQRLRSKIESSNADPERGERINTSEGDRKWPRCVTYDGSHV